VRVGVASRGALVSGDRQLSAPATASGLKSRRLPRGELPTLRGVIFTLGMRQRQGLCSA
jgi:hypothetical protein